MSAHLPLNSFWVAKSDAPDWCRGHRIQIGVPFGWFIRDPTYWVIDMTISKKGSMRQSHIEKYFEKENNNG